MVESGSLENCCGGNSTVSSNLTLSASLFINEKTGGVLATKSETFTAKILSIFSPACRRSHIAHAPVALPWGRAPLAAALAGGLLANAMLIWLCCGFWLGGGSQKPQRPNQLVYKNGWPLLPLQRTKRKIIKGRKVV